MKTVKEIKEWVKTTDISDEEKIELLSKDERKAVQGLCKQLQRNIEKKEKLQVKLKEMSRYENHYFQAGYQLIGGLDEVGRGPLAGPVVTALVILPKDHGLLGLDDSKKLSEKERNRLYVEIMAKAKEVIITERSPQRIDEINILEATKEAMREAVEKSSLKPEVLLIDAMNLGTSCIEENLVKGDQRSVSIAAAAIVAKVTRDRYMVDMHQQYPYYDFASNKGYGTGAHIAGLKKHGKSPLHRESFLKNLEV